MKIVLDALEWRFDHLTLGFQGVDSGVRFERIRRGVFEFIQQPAASPEEEVAVNVVSRWDCESKQHTGDRRRGVRGGAAWPRAIDVITQATNNATTANSGR